jgi:hypothetical protein
MTTNGKLGVGRVVRSAATTVLVVGSMTFAAPAFAAQHNTGDAHSAYGQAQKQANRQHHVATSHRGHLHSVGSQTADPGGGSAVSLPRPNGLQAQADPDGMLNGGVDQPGGHGGVDTTTQDGNNGSGNDTDCEDDNRGVGVPGHCKDRPGTVTPPTGENTPPADTPGGTDVPGETGDAGDVAGPVVPQGAPLAAPTGVPSVFAGGSVRTPAAVVAGPAARAGVLPSTGASQILLELLIAGVAALAVGAGLTRQSRRSGRS